MGYRVPVYVCGGMLETAAAWPKKVKWNYSTIDIVIDSTGSKVYVVHPMTRQVLVFSSEGELIQSWPLRDPLSWGENRRYLIDLDAETQLVYILGEYDKIVQVFTPEGQLVRECSIDFRSDECGIPSIPCGMVVDSKAGQLHVAGSQQPCGTVCTFTL